MADCRQLAADERRDLAGLLETLTPEQWEQPSLCDGWSVRDVVAHLISYEELGYLGTAAALVRAGFRLARSNETRRQAYRDHTPEQLVAVLRAHLRPSGLTAAFSGAIGLTDSLIHHQDIRRALGLPRDIPTERLVEALDFSLRAPVLSSRRNLANLSATATDIDWHHGNGPAIRGPGEAILMALAGRVAALEDLQGPGASVLAERLDKPLAG